jgi:hypothetical protein
MVKQGIAFLAGALMLTSTAVDAQVSMRVRGTITAFDGNVLEVKSREGENMRIALTDKTAVATMKALTLADIKPGDGIGTAAMKRADGKLVALEIHKFPAERGVPNEGHRPWDLVPGSTMTNAAVTGMVEVTGGREITLAYKGGSAQLIVPDGVPIVIAVDADRSALVPGEHVFLTATVGADGKMTTGRVQVSKDGVKPPQ